MIFKAIIALTFVAIFAVGLIIAFVPRLDDKNVLRDPTRGPRSRWFRAVALVIWAVLALMVLEFVLNLLHVHW